MKPPAPSISEKKGEKKKKKRNLLCATTVVEEDIRLDNVLVVLCFVE